MIRLAICLIHWRPLSLSFHVPCWCGHKSNAKAKSFSIAINYCNFSWLNSANNNNINTERIAAVSNTFILGNPKHDCKWCFCCLSSAFTRNLAHTHTHAAKHKQQTVVNKYQTLWLRFVLFTRYIWFRCLLFTTFPICWCSLTERMCGVCVRARCVCSFIHTKCQVHSNRHCIRLDNDDNVMTMTQSGHH